MDTSTDDADSAQQINDVPYEEWRASIISKAKAILNEQKNQMN